MDWKFYKNWKISRKITTVVAGSAILSGIFVGSGAIYIATNTMNHDTQLYMHDVGQAIESRLNNYLDTIDEDLKANAKSTRTAQYIEELNGGWNTLEGSNAEKSAYLKKYYVEKNTGKGDPSWSKDGLYNAGDGSFYSAIHESVHSHFRPLKDAKGYYDVFLVNTKGDVVYTVFKEADYATNLLNGEWASTGLGETFKAIKQNKNNKDFIYLDDFKPYAPSNNVPAAFVGSPVYDDKGEFKGAIIFQMPIDRFNTILSNTDTENEMIAYVTGPNNLLRNDLDHTKENEILSVAFDPMKANYDINFSFEDGEKVLTGKGLKYDNAYIFRAPFEHRGVKWNAYVEVNSAELIASFYELIITIISIMLVTSSILAAFAIMFSRGFANPIIALTNCVAKLAQGQSAHIPCQDQMDEIGELARSMETVHNESEKAKRIQAAVDGVQSSVMIADTQMNIIYANSAIYESFRKSASYLQMQMGVKDVNNFVGYSFNNFNIHDLQRKSGVQNTRLVFDNRTFDVLITAVQNDKGEAIGYVAEWNEKTQELVAQQEEARMKEVEAGIERQIANVIDAVAGGNFDQRLSFNDNRPFIQGVSSGINSMCEIVNRFLGDLDQTIAALADGDLGKKMSSKYSGQFEEVKEKLNYSMDRLSSTITEIVGVGTTIRQASLDITQGADDLSGRTEAQAASIEQTVATMEEISSSVRSNAQSSIKAAEQSKGVLSQAETGGQVVEKAVNAMQQIENSANRITEIVAVIDSIASQTNLLALNAAVEAARAGEAGKGFAVVASEVRTLASRCSEAARDIRSLISSSNSQVVEGVKLVNATGKSLKEIVDSVRNVGDMIQQISHASREQATGVEEISTAISQMDEMTQQNAALSDESAAAARSLSTEAERLATLVSMFKVSNSAGGTVLKGTLNSLQKEKPVSYSKPAATSKSYNDEDNISSTFPKNGAGSQANYFDPAAGDDWSDL